MWKINPINSRIARVQQRSRRKSFLHSRIVVCAVVVACSGASIQKQFCDYMHVPLNLATVCVTKTIFPCTLTSTFRTSDFPFCWHIRSLLTPNCSLTQKKGEMRELLEMPQFFVVLEFTSKESVAPNHFQQKTNCFLNNKTVSCPQTHPHPLALIIVSFFQQHPPEQNMTRNQLVSNQILASFYAPDNCWCTNFYSMLFTGLQNRSFEVSIYLWQAPNILNENI